MAMSSAKKIVPKGYSAELAKVESSTLLLSNQGKISKPTLEQRTAFALLKKGLALVEQAREKGFVLREGKVILEHKSLEYLCVAATEAEIAVAKRKTAPSKEEATSSEEEAFVVTPKPVAKKTAAKHEGGIGAVTPKPMAKKAGVKSGKKLKEREEDAESEAEIVSPKPVAKKAGVKKPTSVKSGKKPKEREEDTESEGEAETPKLVVKKALSDQKEIVENAKKAKKVDSSSETTPAAEMKKVPTKDSVPNTTILPIVETATRRSILFDRLTASYEADYAPPGTEESTIWARNAYVDDVGYTKYAPKAKVYVTLTKDWLPVVRRLVTEREPVNITMVRHYKSKDLATLAGYRTSYYQRYYETTGSLAPNIGVYTLAPFKTKSNILLDLHIYHAVGYAFDIPTQPDYKVLHDKTETLTVLYSALFERIFRCANDQKLSTIIISVVGGGAFSTLYPGGEDTFRKEIWIPAFEAIKKLYPKIKVSLMVYREDRISKHFEKQGYSLVPKFPDFLYKSSFQAKETLIVNAWDPHSIPGNGNKGDPSLDGRIGRQTAIQFFGCGLSNPYLLQNISWGL